MFGETWYSYQTFGFAFALILALWAIFNIAPSNASPFSKAVWIVVVLFIPLLGFLAWLLFGPKKK